MEMIWDRRKVCDRCDKWINSTQKFQVGVGDLKYKYSDESLCLEKNLWKTCIEECKQFPTPFPNRRSSTSPAENCRQYRLEIQMPPLCLAEGYLKPLTKAVRMEIDDCNLNVTLHINNEFMNVTTGGNVVTITLKQTVHMVSIFA